VFERAAIFSSLVCLILFGVLGTMYLEFMVAKDIAIPTAKTTQESN
jgi:hypothetical protein